MISASVLRQYVSPKAHTMLQRKCPGRGNRPEFTRRIGRTIKTEAQISLLGLELGIEGPIAKNGSSFITVTDIRQIGLLSKLGVKFGDEDISYQDFMFHYSPTSKKQIIPIYVYRQSYGRLRWSKDSILRN